MNYYKKNKFNAVKTYSELCQRTFDSKAEAKRGEELCLLEKAGEISELEYQHTIQLCEIKHFVTQITIDFKYKKDGEVVYEDVKGSAVTPKRGKVVARVDRDFRTKLAWLRDKYGIEVVLTKDK